MKKLLILTVVSLGLVTGCENDYHKFSHKLPSTKVEQDKSDSISGIDADNNGIRDDIDKFIVEQYNSEEDQSAVRQMARNTQSKLLLTNSAEAEEIKAIYDRQIEATVCLGVRRDSSESSVYEGTIKDILQITLNTDLREKAYRDYGRMVGTLTANFPEGSDDGCNYPNEPK